MRGDGRFPKQELASGGNWARADRMWCWTRLLDGNRADKIMTELLAEQGFENVATYQHASYDWQRPDLYKENDSLFCHFQLDATASLPGCIAEMLLQSHLDEIDLLPALPDELPTGKVSGLRARGGFTVDMEWRNGELIWANIHGQKNKTIPVIRIRNSIIDPGKTEFIKIIYDEKN
jgi:alpha-L-fucosidase 2